MKIEMKFKKSILFRISGGSAKNQELGLGHIHRALNLSMNLVEYQIHFLVQDYGGSLDVLKKIDKKFIHKLNVNISLDEDVKTTCKLIKKEKIDLLIIDKFDRVTKPYAMAMKKIVKTIVISDTDKIDYNTDLVVNGFVGFANSIKKNRFGTKCLLGPKYQILSKEYEKNNIKEKNPETILVTFGGYDNLKLVELFCKQMIRYIGSLKIKIILGSSTKKTKKLINLESKFDNLSIVNTSLNFKNDIKNSKFVFCAGGISTYEFAILHVPFAIICQYKHQLKTARVWRKNRVALNFGFKSKILEKRLESKLLNLSRNSSEVNFDTNFKIDGFGSKRVSLEIKKLLQ